MKKKILFLLLGISLLFERATAQLSYPYPPPVIDNTAISSGTYNFQHTQPISAPTNPVSGNNVTIDGTANVQMLSGTEVTLSPGFTASAANSSFSYRAAIQPNITSLDLVLVPNDYTSVVGSAIHINKWEKFEVAFKLPNEYEQAISTFFPHYYAYNSSVNANDLNPYADDSLEVKVDVYSPTGRHFTKWAFFMREASFSGTDDVATLTEATNQLTDYHWHFRFSPDEVSSSAWSFTISVSAPHSDQNTFPSYSFGSFQFYCDQPQSDNHGYLQVSGNHRYLKFNDNTPFFGIGENTPDISHDLSFNCCDHPERWVTMYNRDFNNFHTAFDEIHEAGGNYSRMFFFPWTFAPEWNNLGVYDSYDQLTNRCPDNSGWVLPLPGNRQYHCWAFDQMVDYAREKDIYIELCVDPAPPIIAYQKFMWGDNCYVRNYVYPSGSASPIGCGNLDANEYFINSGLAGQPSQNVEYYWKRKYKYIMNRWGYSVNIADFETFNEIDQTLGYHPSNLTVPDGGSHLRMPNILTSDDNSTCNCNQVTYSVNPNLIGTIRQWHSDIVSFAKNIDGGKHMFSVSYAGSTDLDLFNLPILDFNDIHSYGEAQNTNWGRAVFEQNAESFSKPFHFGECSSFGQYYESPFGSGSFTKFPVLSNPANAQGVNLTSNIYHNYDVTFHNELWATAFDGSYSAGLTWQWNVTHWQQDNTPTPVDDRNQGDPHSNQLSFQNVIYDQFNQVSGYIGNRKCYHNLKPLSDFINTQYGCQYLLNSSVAAGHYYSFDGPAGIEAYYLRSPVSSLIAVGWVHNIAHFWQFDYYYGNYLNGSNWEHYDQYNECYNIPTQTSTFDFDITGMFPNQEFNVSFYPTRMGSYSLPAVINTYSSPNGTISVHAPLGCDSIDADYAFEVDWVWLRPVNLSTDSVSKSKETFDFSVYPNPSNQTIAITVDKIKDSACTIRITDVLGKQIHIFENVRENKVDVDVSSYSKGVYYVKVIYNNNQQTKLVLVN